MVRKHFLNLVFFIILQLSSSSCSKESYAPPPSPSFINYFRCTINGVPVIFDGYIFASPPYKPNALFKFQLITGRQQITPDNEIYISLEPFAETTGEINLIDKNSVHLKFNGRVYVVGQQNGVQKGSGKVIIIEVTPQQIKGSFEFITTDINSGNGIDVAKGEFHLKRG